MADEISYVSGDRKREGIFASYVDLREHGDAALPAEDPGRQAGHYRLGNTLGTIFSKQAEDLLIKFGVRGDKITSLSGGNQQKVLIGRGLADAA